MRNPLLVFLFAYIMCNAYGQDKWVKGTYYDLKGEKHKGLISRQKSTLSFIKFKSNDESAISKLSSTNIKCFTAGLDSFTVSHAPNLQQYPFLRVVINWTLKMYVSRQTMVSLPSKSVPRYQYISDLYYYGSNPDNLTEMKSTNFLDAMDKILTTKPELFKKIKLKEYTFNDMEEIVIDYNAPITEKPKAD